MGCGSSKATPIVPTPQRLLLPLPDGDAPESVVSRSVSVGKQLSLVDGKYARCELSIDNSAAKLVGTLVNSTVRLLDVTANRLPEEAKAELREVAAVRGDEVLIDLGDDDGK